jgi:hypothetical protein
MKIIEKDGIKIVVENNIARVFTPLTGPNGLSVPIDGEDVEILATYNSQSYVFYFKDKTHTYYVCGASKKRMKSSRMEILSREYAKDIKNVYCEGLVIPGADPETFSIPSNSIYFAYDKSNVYALARHTLHIFTDADIDTIQFFPQEIKYHENGEDKYICSCDYFVDALRIYHFNRFFVEYIQASEGDVLRQFLQTSFPQEIAWWNRGEDYFASLRKIFNFHYTDGKTIYYYLGMESYSSGENQQEIHYPYIFGSSCHTSYFNALINADVASFQSLNEYYAKDKNSVFHLSRRINADHRSFEVISRHFARDKDGLWYNGFFVGEFDQNTFKIIDDTSLSTLASDRFGGFYSEYNAKVGKYQCRSKILKRESRKM